MTDKKNRRKNVDRRDLKNLRAEEFLEFFISKDKQKRSGKERRKSESKN